MSCSTNEKPVEIASTAKSLPAKLNTGVPPPSLLYSTAILKLHGFALNALDWRAGRAGSQKQIAPAQRAAGAKTSSWNARGAQAPVASVTHFLVKLVLAAPL